MRTTPPPTMTVTFLFTDIEGSTRLIDDLGEDRYIEALAEHRRLLRAAFCACGGVEIDTQGDAFLYAFSDPENAVAAATQGQQLLSSGPVKVRIGLHTGVVRLTDEGYAGRELHRAARIAASGHGGQVVVSAATAALVECELLDLGEHRLKDFVEPVALFQLGRKHFPPLKTISNTNLPRPASSFVGRARERNELLDLLRGNTRLVTLSGPGGSGKTRLALEVAHELVPGFKAGVFWVGLAALRDPTLVIETIAQTLGAKDSVAGHIGERELLLLVDNFEQVVEAGRDIGELLDRCPNLRLMVTSRELLRIRGELEYPVPPLADPEGVELFSERSRLEPDARIAQLCRRLDELPLAIELAAARTSVLSPAQILERLSQRLDLLKGGRDSEARHETLRATIEWSHDLLQEDEQQLFARMAVFRGGCMLEAAEAVADAEIGTLQSLVEKSLLRHTGERFWLLETIREYARERLTASGEEADLRRRHAFFALDFAEAVYLGDHDAISANARIEAEHDNLRSALEWARDSGADEVLLRLAAALVNHWRGRGQIDEEETWLALSLARGSSPARARMKVLRRAGGRAVESGEHARADVLIAQARSLAEEERDEIQVLRAMDVAALNTAARGDLDLARVQLAALRERASEIGDRSGVARADVSLSDICRESGDLEAALDYAEEAVELCGELGNHYGLGLALGNSGDLALRRSDLLRAEDFFREACAVLARIDAIHLVVGWCMPGLAAALVARQADSAAQLLGAAASLREELGIGFAEDYARQLHDRAAADAKAALGDDACRAAWARGEAMTVEESVNFAQSAR